KRQSLTSLPPTIRLGLPKVQRFVQSSFESCTPSEPVLPEWHLADGAAQLAGVQTLRIIRELLHRAHRTHHVCFLGVGIKSLRLRRQLWHRVQREIGD